MKKIILALAVLLSVQVADAQTKAIDAAKQAAETAKAASEDAKKATKVATWLKLADAYMEAYNAPAGSAWVGASKAELQLVLKERPFAVEEVVVGEETLVRESYAARDYYFTPAGQLVMIVVTQPVYPDVLERALDAYKKAYEVDVKKSKVKDITTGIETVSKKLYEDGMNYYSLDDYAKAVEYFAKAFEASVVEPYSTPNNDALYNAGFVAWASQDWETAKKHFEKCMEIGYYYENGEVYAKLSDIYAKLGDKAASVAILEKGFTAYPQSQSILIGLINYYLESGENTDRLFELIGEAKKNEPENVSLYYVEGNIHKQLGDNEKALAAYKECSKLNPEYDFGYHGQGALYYDMAVAVSEKAAQEMDDAKYAALVKEYEQYLLNAIEPFEKAFEVTKNDQVKLNAAEYLKNIYYRFSSVEDKYMQGYKKYDEYVKSNVQ